MIKRVKSWWARRQQRIEVRRLTAELEVLRMQARYIEGQEMRITRRLSELCSNVPLRKGWRA